MRKIMVAATLLFLSVPAPALAVQGGRTTNHDSGGYGEGDCDWSGDCGGYDERNGGYGDGRGGDGRFGGGRSGDYDGGPGDDCRNACGNTIIVPTPGDRGGEQR